MYKYKQFATIVMDSCRFTKIIINISALSVCMKKERKRRRKNKKIKINKKEK